MCVISQTQECISNTSMSPASLSSKLMHEFESEALIWRTEEQMGYVTSLWKATDLNPVLTMNNVIKLSKHQMGNRK